jgi:Zn-dependent M28 family amino/carboxypeptidase
VKRTHLTVALTCAAVLVAAPAAGAKGGDKVDTKKLRKGVTVDGILEHERAFQRIAIAHDGNRAATTAGYDASVDYVVNRLRAAGYKVSLDGFDFPLWTLNSPSTFAEVSPTARTFAEGTDYIVSQFSGAGDVTARVVPTNDIESPPPGGPGTGTSGCEPGDFPAATAGNIALMQRGTCPFVQKYQMAKDAGAVAALIFNDGGEGRTSPIFITAPVNIGIPTIMTSFDVGQSLLDEARAGTVTAHVAVDATTTPNTEYNVIADSRSGDRDRTIVLGAHLDSVEAGPGINDNGSGSSTILEIAEQMAKLKDPRNRMRFAFWGAEEAGLVGSTAYVAEQVDNGGIDEIEANLNFDMVGSPNFVRFVYDGDLSDSPPPPSGAPNGSAQIEQLFLRYFRSRGLVTDPTAFDGRSDYGPFIANGVPAGGLFTGAEGIKTARQEAIYGGFAGLAYDPCYHQACDTFFNLNHTALDQMSDAAAHAAWTLAQSRKAVTELSAKATKKSKRAKRGKHWKYKGPFRVR